MVTGQHRQMLDQVIHLFRIIQNGGAGVEASFSIDDFNAREQLRNTHPAVPEIRCAVRTGDTDQRERLAHHKRPPHILVTTPESLYVMLGTQSGRQLLQTASTVIVDEIHLLNDTERGPTLEILINSKNREFLMPSKNGKEREKSSICSAFG